MTALGDLTGGKYFSEAAAVSTDGLVVVGRSHSTKGPEAFRWTSATGMAALGDLPGGAVYSEATGVSGDGTIVVGMSNSTVEADVFLWTASAGMRSLAALCRAAGVDLNGWRFPYCRPLISEDGNSMTGDAISPQMDQVVWRLSGVRELAAQTPTLFWQGDSLANVWDVGSNATWTDGAASTAFANAKKVTFDDFGTNTNAIAVTGTLAPSAVVVDASINYTFAGAGSLTGTMSLLKAGTGTATLGGTYRYSGGTTIKTGTMA
jgi:probable HAF family extracellular repeat protein